MEQLLERIEQIKKSSMKEVIDRRLQEFMEFRHKGSNEIFSELCFCFLTANFNAEKSIRIQMEIGDGFLTLSEKELAEKLRLMGHRFPDARAKYIVDSRKYKDDIKNKLQSFENDAEMRDWVVESIKGIGYKEASHFLRNIGYDSVAIIDFHIIDLLAKHKIIQRPKTLTRKRYMEIENTLREIGKGAGMNLAELDLYLWFIETGKVLK